MRQICEVLGSTRSNLYYHPKQDPSEAMLRDEIETLALRYPTYKQTYFRHEFCYYYLSVDTRCVRRNIVKAYATAVLDTVYRREVSR